jgi:hypothetical protein
MPPTNKIEATLAIKSDTSAATRAMQELVDLAKKLGVETKKSGDEMKRMGGGGPGGGVGGRLGGAALPLLGLQAGANMIDDVLRKVTDSLKIFGDTTISVNQRIFKASIGILESIPAVGSVARSIRELVEEIKFGSGMRGVDRTQERVSSELGVMSINSRRDARLDGLRDQFMSARFAEQAVSANPSRVRGFDFGRDVRTAGAMAGILPGDGDLSGILGKTGAGVFNAALGFGSGIANIGLGLSEAIKPDSVRAAEMEVRRAERRQKTTLDEFNRLEGIRKDQQTLEEGALDVPLGHSQPNRPGGRPLRIPFGLPFGGTVIPTRGGGDFGIEAGDGIASAKALIETQKKLQERKDAQLRLEDNIRKSQAKGLELEQRKLDVAQKQLDVRKAELAVVKDQETNRRNARSAFQTLDPLGRQNLVEAVKIAQERGIENVPQDVKELLLSSPITQNFARNQLPEPDQDPAFKELNRLLGGGLDLEPIQKRREELQRKIEEDTDKMEKSYAAAVTKVTERFTSFLEAITNAISDTEKKFLSNQQKLQAQSKQ